MYTQVLKTKTTPKTNEKFLLTKMMQGVLTSSQLDVKMQMQNLLPFKVKH